ncbi:GNAT family N-acetyltransferase [Halobacterium jilantaiense]|uniref:L-amino acid N-acyltransferase YncA n=1 Tax=Halobacterium jilantaiense TaxID=355548 RepID=A0A1I0Q166_9EURY|nr:GNAT family N-acetyltransferase [Halobacterium jilantaiense]SEW20688.1 L-amino acid N-acyltransferase YncA [Halobacterium jilantaiense]
MNVREARPGDASAVRRVADAAWHDAHAPIVGPETVEEFLANYYDVADLRARYAEDDGSTTFVAEDGEVVGYATGVPTDDAYDLAAIYVHPDRQSEGVGSRLVETVESRARETDYDTLRLVVMADNDSSRGFYEAHGFEHADDDYDSELGVQNCIYEKRLD